VEWSGPLIRDTGGNPVISQLKSPKTPGAKRTLSSLVVTTLVASIASGIVVSCSNNSSTAKPNLIVKDAPKAGILAKINGKEITEEMLIGDAKMDFFEIKKREYDLRKERLNKLMQEELIGAEAKKANLSTDEFIEKSVVKGDIKIGDSDYEKFVKERNVPKDQITPQIKERIMTFMKTQKRQDLVDAYVAKLTKDNPVEVYFAKPRVDVKVEIGDSPAFGNKDAKVTVVEYSDFQCPFCAKGANVVTEIKKKYGSKVRVAFKHFPLPMHPEARPASEASMCINEQSPDKFWKFHDLLFKEQKKMSADDLKAHAKAVGADMKKFEECVGAKKFAKFVQDDMDAGEKIGVRSTPTFFVNGQMVAGALPFAQFQEMIDDELESEK
jgi:protein-disulfide isomerase